MDDFLSFDIVHFEICAILLVASFCFFSQQIGIFIAIVMAIQIIHKNANMIEWEALLMFVC